MIAVLVFVLLGTTAVQARGETVPTGKVAAWEKASGGQAILAVLHEADLVKGAPAFKPIKSGGMTGVQLASGQSVLFYRAALFARVVSTEPMLVRSAWVGIVELRI